MLTEQFMNLIQECAVMHKANDAYALTSLRDDGRVQRRTPCVGVVTTQWRR